MFTDAVIDNLQVYYGKAIRESSSHVNKMKTGIWETSFHLISTDKKPQHELCSEGDVRISKFSDFFGERYVYKKTYSRCCDDSNKTDIFNM